MKNKRDIDSRYRRKRIFITVVSVLILSALYAFKNSSYLIRSASAIALLVFFYIVDHYYDLDFKRGHYVFILIIAISSFLLSPLYFIYPNYDKIQHLVQPILLSSIFYHFISRLKIEKKWQLTFLFFVMVGLSGLFELGEYFLDYLFDWKLQGVFLRNISGFEKYDILLDRIDDTMIDMALSALGTAIYIGFVLIKGRLFVGATRKRL